MLRSFAEDVALRPKMSDLICTMTNHAEAHWCSGEVVITDEEEHPLHEVGHQAFFALHLNISQC